jgi:hypothetical protein
VNTLSYINPLTSERLKGLSHETGKACLVDRYEVLI